jgi:hypothetical protein
MNNVPPYGAFGDWATPKEPTAELFLPSSLSDLTKLLFWYGLRHEHG